MAIVMVQNQTRIIGPATDGEGVARQEINGLTGVEIHQIRPEVVRARRGQGNTRS